MIDPVVLGQVSSTLLRAQSVFIAAHIMPDGDCVGSQLGLGLALRALGKRVTFALDDRIPESLTVLECAREIAPRVPGEEEVFVYVDGSDSQRYGKTLDRARTAGRPVINIDHHATNEPFADINLVDNTASSTAEIVYALLRVLGAPVSPGIAQALLTGIVTDTLGFRTAATTPETLTTAAGLVRAGGSIPEIIDRAYNRRSLGALRLLGYALTHAHLDGDVMWSAVDARRLQEFGSNGNGASGVVNQLLTAADAQIAFFLVEKPDGRGDLGLRSREGTDVSGIAYRLGGGGHKQAAGAMLPPPFETAPARVLAAIRQERS